MPTMRKKQPKSPCVSSRWAPARRPQAARLQCLDARSIALSAQRRRNKGDIAERGVIRVRGRFPKGASDVSDGSSQSEERSSPADQQLTATHRYSECHNATAVEAALNELRHGLLS